MHAYIQQLYTYMHSSYATHFNYRRRKVAKAASEKWPGNNIPTFRNNKENLQQLDHLVEKLVPECQLPHFGKKQIRQHILDCLNERRRQIRKGHDYSLVSKLLLL